MFAPPPSTMRSVTLDSRMKAGGSEPPARAARRGGGVSVRLPYPSKIRIEGCAALLAAAVEAISPCTAAQLVIEAGTLVCRPGIRSWNERAVDHTIVLPLLPLGRPTRQ